MRARRSRSVEELSPSFYFVLYKENRMLHYAVVFFIIALIAAVLGFGGVAAGAAGIAKILFCYLPDWRHRDLFHRTRPIRLGIATGSISRDSKTPLS